MNFTEYSRPALWCQIRNRVAWCLMVLGTLSLVGEQAPGHTSHEIGTLMQQLHSRGQFNGAVLVARQGKIIYRGSSGRVPGFR